ncbi:hypothetical protein ACWGI0_18900 [Streptomyces sp. NPDC054802]
MGVSIEVLIVDWAHIECAEPDKRAGTLDEAAFGDEAIDVDQGWTWPTAQSAAWYASYTFAGTLGSYKPHFWAGERWEDIRDFADPDLRSRLDRFASVLFWSALEFMEDAEDVPQRSLPWPADILMWSTPDETADLRELWDHASAQLETLREPFDLHAAVLTGWINDFDTFVAFLKGWGEVVTEAHSRGWGIVGLRC